MARAHRVADRRTGTLGAPAPGPFGRADAAGLRAGRRHLGHRPRAGARAARRQPTPQHPQGSLGVLAHGASVPGRPVLSSNSASMMAAPELGPKDVKWTPTQYS